MNTLKESIAAVCTLLFVVFSFSASLQAQQYPFRVYSVEHGLAGAEVQDIIQDQKGYLWFATSNGLSKFDGIRFTNITEENGLSDNNIIAMLEDSSGRIWCATQRSGVNVLDDLDIIQFTRDDGLGANQIRIMFEDRLGVIWLGTVNGGITKYDGTAFTTFTEKDGLPHNTVTAVSEDADGVLWVGTPAGLCKWTGGKFQIVSLRTLLKRQREPVISGLFSDIDGSVYCVYRAGSTIGSGIIRIDKDSLSTFGPSFRYGLVRTLRDSYGNFWFGTANRGALKFDGKTVQNYTTELGLPVNIVRAIFEDREGNIWFGLAGSGAAKLISDAFRNYAVGNVRSMLEDRNGPIWFGRGPEGIAQLQNEQVVPFDKVRAGWVLHEDRKGNLWFAGRQTLIRYDGREAKEFRMRVSRSPGGLVGDRRMFWRILEDSRGTNWFGNMGGGGLHRFDGDTHLQYDDSNGLSGNNILMLHEDSDGNVWIGTTTGLNRYTGSGFEQYTRADGLSGDAVFYVLEDSRGYLWLSAYGPGITRFDGTEFRTYLTSDGSAGSRVLPLIEDKHGHIWFLTEDGFSSFDGNEFTEHKNDHGLFEKDFRFLHEHKDQVYIGTNAGVYQFDPVKVYLKEYSSRDGLISDVMNIGGAYTDSKGILWFSTPLGVTRFAPDRYHKSRVSPPVYISALRVFNRQMPPMDTIELQHDQNFLRISFAGLSFTNPEAVRYRYRLDGLESEWSETFERSVPYPYLPHGKYTFIVEACNSDGLWSAEPATVSVTVLPPFWSTWWFRSILILLGGALLYGSRRYTLHAMRRRQRELEIAVKERTRELEEQQKQELKMAYEIQLALLPKTTPPISGYDIAGASRPAQSVGGDYFDYIALDDRRWVICLGDISGKGLPAAMLMSNLQGIIRSQSQLQRPAEDSLSRLNRQLYNSTEANHFATLFYSVLDAQSHELKYINAGHNPPLKIGRDISPQFLSAGGPVLGFLEHSTYRQDNIRLDQQDLVVMYSDGVTEAMNAAAVEFGEERLVEIVRSHYGSSSSLLLNTIIQEVDAYSAGIPQSDDITVVVVQRTHVT